MTNIITKIIITFTNGIAIWLIGTEEPQTNEARVVQRSATNWDGGTLIVSNIIVGTNWWWTNGITTNWCPQVVTNNPTDEAIKDQAKSGRICQVLGHAWASHLHTTLEWNPNAKGCQECKVCGKHRTLYHQWSE